MSVELIKKLADYNLILIKEKGYAISGNNGPYNDDDIPVRNSAHWLITYIYLYNKTKQKKYYEISKKLAKYLMNDDLYGKSGTIKIRNNRDTDYTNGLIGEAWVIEALVEAAFFFKDDKYYIKALSIFKSEPFDQKLKLWKIKDLDGTCTAIDYVYNHQLWFAAAGNLILNYKYDKEIDQEIILFLNNYKLNLGIQPSGALFHQVNYNNNIKSKISLFIKCFLCDYKIGKRWKKQNELQEGYETFDFYGFALLYNRYKNLDIFKNNKFKKALNYCLDSKRIEKLYIPNKYINKYSYPYNSPAFEYPFIAKTFYGKIDEKLFKKLLSNQLIITQKNLDILDNNNNDKYTLTARIYELSRYYYLMEKSYNDEKN